MSKKNNELHLSSVLKVLEKAHSEILKTQGYNKSTAKMKLLMELIKEQNENTHSPTR